MSKKYTGVVGFLDSQKDRMMRHLHDCIEDPTSIDMEIIGGGHTAAAALNLMGLLPDEEFHDIYTMICVVNDLRSAERFCRKIAEQTRGE